MWTRRRRLAQLSLSGVIGMCLSLPACGGNDAVELPTPSGSYEEGTVPGVLLADGRFDALVALLEVAKVSQGPPGAQQVIGSAANVAGMPGWDHTVFAPTDAAFLLLDEDTIGCMFDEANATQAVRIHLVPELLTSDGFDTGEVQTIAGSMPLELVGDRAWFAGSRIIEPDIEATNGVVHVINAVNVPDDCDG
jgi:uncharacterized surface protein with fasciclin (FAS1) repeats